MVEPTQISSHYGVAPLVEIFVARPTEAAHSLVRERVKVKIEPDQAYGPIDPQKRQEIPLDKIPEDARKVGTLLSAQGFDGPIRVAEVRPDVVVLDFNHPLAGKALTFDVLVLSIN